MGLRFTGKRQTGSMLAPTKRRFVSLLVVGVGCAEVEVVKITRLWLLKPAVLKGKSATIRTGARVKRPTFQLCDRLPLMC